MLVRHNRSKRLDGVLVFPYGLHLPLLDRGEALDGLAFVSHDGMACEAPSQGVGIAGVLCRNIRGDRFGKIDRHSTSPYFFARNSRMTAMVAAGCSSISQWPEFGTTAPVTLAATKRRPSAMPLPKDFSAPPPTTAIFT